MMTRTHSSTAEHPAHNRQVLGSSPSGSTTIFRGPVAQLEEHRPSKPVAESSNLSWPPTRGIRRSTGGGPVAQMVEQLAFNQLVQSSSLCRPTSRQLKKHGPIVQLVGCRSPKPEISVQVGVGLPIEQWPASGPCSSKVEHRSCKPGVASSSLGQGLQSPLTTTKGDHAERMSRAPLERQEVSVVRNRKVARRVGKDLGGAHCHQAGFAHRLRQCRRQQPGHDRRQG